MTAHTPGSWTLKARAMNHQQLFGPTPGLIADIHKDEDARLIAAAPDLLAALRDIVSASEANCGDSLANAINFARAAIAKATGA